jgi:ApaG protein
MVTQVTQGIKISVRTEYKSEYSNPLKNHYFFSYRISIENMGDFPVQLLKRHWFIFDSSGEHSEVEGDGVIGVQPYINPGELFEYESACSLKTDIGKMQGTYLMDRMDNGQNFYVHIPEFRLIAPFKMN